MEIETELFYYIIILSCHNNIMFPKSHHGFLKQLDFFKLQNPYEILVVNRIQTYFQKQLFDHYLAIYHPFPKEKTAEYELLKRLEKTCQKLRLGCFILHNNNIIQNTELKGIDIRHVDTRYILCILSLHYSSPKTTQHFTLLPLWNPISYHDHRAWTATMSMDGYLSAHSDSIDALVQSKSKKPFLGYLNTSLSDPVLDIHLEHFKCFYVGINWEFQNSQYSLYRKKVMDLIQRLDALNIVSIYGPPKSWHNFQSYVGELEFDGESVIHEISQCGICLVLSSDAHIQDAVCSNRLFEGLAAGVPIIADQNPFIHKWFGDHVFYIDTASAEIAAEQIQRHVEYIQSYPEETLEKMRYCRKIFLEHFLMDSQVAEIVQQVINRGA